VLSAELSHRVGGLRLDVRFEVGAGRCLALAGPSGAGKTTILRLLAGTLRPRSGRVACGADTWVDTAHDVCWAPERRRCGYVFQDYALFPHLSAWRNVAYGIRGVARADRRERALELLERLGVAERADARPGELSGGERQRVALARALAAEPAALLLDEPLSALDSRTRADAMRTLVSIVSSSSVPVVLVTHEFAEASQLGDEVGVVDTGAIVQRGSPEALAARPASAFVADFTGAVVLTGTVRSSDDGLTVVELDGGGVVSSIDSGSGRVAVSVHPWEITLSPLREAFDESAQNHLRARVSSLTTVSNRVRVALAAGQPLLAEVTGRAAAELGLAVGSEVVASWKATATRLSAL
jgi:molybdenum ABC transporter ATP-binding protein